MKRRKSIFLLLLALGLLVGAAPPPTNAPGNAPTKKVEEPRDQKEKIRTSKGVLPMTATEKKQFDDAMAKPDNVLLKSYLIGDYETGKIYKEHNADIPVGLASTTKLMTVYCVMDAVDRGEIAMKDPVTIDHAAASMHGSVYKTKEGEVYTVEELLHAGMIVSGNDAMIALADRIAGSEAAFVTRMNAKAQEMGFTHMHFINVHGLTDYAANDYNMATAREMFELSRQLLRKYPIILDAACRLKIEEPDRGYKSFATNPLLGILPGIDGLKTGYTGAAGRCFIATGKTKAEGNFLPTRFIGVYMGAENDMNRYAASLRLSEEAMSHRNKIVAGKSDELGLLELNGASPRKNPVYVNKDVVYNVGPGEEIKRYVDYYEITPPHSRKEPVGVVRFMAGDKEVAKREVFVKEDIKKPNPILTYRDLMADVFRAMEKAA
ncbi:MAG: D-alanyl-D-alanine carboxypeptidase family protein [Peptoniphilus sp.]|nr:D-alanyl-D-alanine carboxypeptidase family protein [Peptoniphilus sp.]MDY3118165.1 D-alanyl-D-alanine carboxypeptidase family protein [Peptoniphilus sp.]